MANKQDSDDNRQNRLIKIREMALERMRQNSNLTLAQATQDVKFWLILEGK
jgi:hypothetical protein